MKYILTLLTAIFFTPFILIGGIIALIKTLFVLTFGLAWQKGDDWHGYLLNKINDFMKWTKE